MPWSFPHHSLEAIHIKVRRTLKKTIAIILFSVQTTLFAAGINVLEVEKESHRSSHLSITPAQVLRHSLQIQITERQLLHICPVSDQPFFYRITLPNNQYFYVLFSFHSFPLELVMSSRKFSKLLDKVNLVVGETAGERGQKLSKASFAEHGLVMDDSVRQQFLDAEKSYIDGKASFLLKGTPQEELARQAQFLDSWYSHVPEYTRQALENNEDLLTDKETLPQLHPVLFVNKMERDLDPDVQAARQEEEFGMDNMVEQLARGRGISYQGLETEEDVLDAGRLRELSEEIQGFMVDAYPTPLQSLQDKIEKMPHSASELPCGGKPKRSYWAKSEGRFEDVNAMGDSMSLDYFHGRVSAFPPSETAIKRTENWKPKIQEIMSTHSRPWLLMVGLKHAEGEYGLLHWFQNVLGCTIGRGANRI